MLTSAPHRPQYNAVMAKAGGKLQYKIKLLLELLDHFCCQPA